MIFLFSYRHFSPSEHGSIEDHWEMDYQEKYTGIMIHFSADADHADFIVCEENPTDPSAIKIFDTFAEAKIFAENYWLQRLKSRAG